MLIRSWLDGFVYAKSGSAADAGESDDAPNGRAPSGGDGPPEAPEEDDDAPDEDAPEEDDDEPADDEGDEEAEAAPDEGEAVAPAFNYSELGLGDDPDTMRQTVAQLRQQAQRVQMLEQWHAYQQQAHQAELARAQAAQQAQQQPAAQPQPPKLPWQIPEFDPRSVQFLERDEHGNLVVKPGGIPTLAQDYQKYQSAREDAINTFLKDPYAIVRQGIQPDLERMLDERDQRLVQQMRQYGELEQLAHRYRSALVDPNGQPTEDGVRFAQAVQYAYQNGIPNPAQYIEEQLVKPVLPYVMAENEKLKAEIAALKKPATPKVANDAAKRAAIQPTTTRSRAANGTFKKGHRRSPPQNNSTHWRDRIAKALDSYSEADLMEE